MRQNTFAGMGPAGSLQRSPDPLAGFGEGNREWRIERARDWRETERKGKERKGRKREREKGGGCSGKLGGIRSLASRGRHPWLGCPTDRLFLIP